MLVIPLPPELPEPCPELVCAQRPLPADIARAAGLLGWLPEAEDRLRPAVPASARTVG